MGRFVSVEGSVEIQRSGEGPWAKGRLDEPLCQGDTIRVGERSRAAVALINDAVLRLDEKTSMRLLDIAGKEEERSLLELIIGACQSLSRAPRVFEVNTPYINGLIEGTEFLMRVEADKASITVFEGKVAASNDRGRLVLTRGESAEAQKGQAPQPRVLARPRDAVQWALYYPPVLYLRPDEFPPGAG
ncbi:MAG: FecR family protein, partial [Gammaproteobacteria bacterium]